MIDGKNGWMDGCIIYGWMDRKYGWIEWKGWVRMHRMEGWMDRKNGWMIDGLKDCVR